jgi:hypothetical protein
VITVILNKGSSPEEKAKLEQEIDQHFQEQKQPVNIINIKE